MLNIRFENLEQELRKISRFQARKRGQLSNIIEATAFRVHGNARKVVRVDTGYLKNSIIVATPQTLTAEVGVDTERTASYAPYVERRYPFLLPAWEVEQSRFINDIREALIT